MTDVTRSLSRDCHGAGLAPEPSGQAGAGAGRDAAGRFTAGNTAALVTGARSVAFQKAAQAERARLRGELLAARGQSERDAPAGLVLAADGAAQAVLLRDAAFERLVEAGGPVTDKDRARRVLAVWQAAADRALKHLALVGLERVEKDATSLPLTAWLERDAR